VIAPLRTLVADDEAAARRGARRALEALGGVEIVAECQNGTAAIEDAMRLAPDLLVLDIEMPGASGFDVLRHLGTRTKAAILLTAYDRYAVDAFDLPVSGYVLKPIEQTRLARAVERARARLLEDRPATAAVATIAVPSRQGFTFLKLEDVEAIGAADNYAELYHGGRTHLLAEPICRLEALLPPFMVRVHRGAIVNLHHVASVRQRLPGAFEVVMQSGKVWRVGRSYRGVVQGLKGVRQF
jgi:two-component system, LytTR family, response regulator